MLSLYDVLDENNVITTIFTRPAQTLVLHQLCGFCDNPRAIYQAKDENGYTVIYRARDFTYVKVDPSTGEIVAIGLIMKCPECGKTLIDETAEHWKNIEGHPLYDVSTKGRIRSYAKSKDGVISKGSHTSEGYLSQSFADTIKNTEYVHRLVAKAFIPNSYGFDVINHKNHNRNDNRISNLEWCNHGYNNKFVKHPRFNQQNDVIIIRKNHKLVGAYQTAREVARMLHVSDMALSKALKGSLVTVAGYDLQLVKEQTADEKKKVVRNDLKTKENSNSSVA